MAFIGNTSTTQSFVAAVDYFSGNASTTAFTLSRPVASAAQVQCVIENVPQTPGSAFTVSGNTITFTSAPPTGTNNIYVYYTNPTTQVIAPSPGTIGPSQLAGTGTPSASTYYRGDGAWAAAGFPSGTVMLFVQTAAPTGWTKSTTHNDKALRIVSGTASSGGSVAFSTAFAAGLSAGATTLTSAQIPAHAHTYNGASVAQCGGPAYATFVNAGNTVTLSTNNNTGGGGSHTHTMPSFAVQYVDVIIATAN